MHIKSLDRSFLSMTINRHDRVYRLVVEKLPTAGWDWQIWSGAVARCGQQPTCESALSAAAVAVAGLLPKAARKHPAGLKASLDGRVRREPVRELVTIQAQADLS